MKNLSTSILLVLTLLFVSSSCQENMIMLDNDEVLSTTQGRNGRVGQDDEILNSKEFKALVKSNKENKKAFLSAAGEYRDTLRKTSNLTQDKRGEFMKRYEEQNKAFTKYVEFNISAIKSDADMEKTKNKFFDKDVLVYQNTRKAIFDKHTKKLKKENAKLLIEFKQKFPSVSYGEFTRLAKSITNK